MLKSSCLISKKKHKNLKLKIIKKANKKKFKLNLNHILKSTHKWIVNGDNLKENHTKIKLAKLNGHFNTKECHLILYNQNLKSKTLMLLYLLQIWN